MSSMTKSFPASQATAAYIILALRHSCWAVRDCANLAGDCLEQKMSVTYLRREERLLTFPTVSAGMLSSLAEM